MLYKTFGNFFAALAFIFAALAIHQSASAYGAFAGDPNSLALYGLVVNTTISQTRANEEAISRCRSNGGGNGCRTNGINRTIVTNQCIAAYSDPDFGPTYMLADTRHEAEAKVGNYCDGGTGRCAGSPFSLFDFRNIEVCDSTCNVADNQFIVDNPFDNAGCRRARNHTECAMVDSITPYYDEEADNCTPVPAGVSLTPEFTIVVDGDAITTSEANPLSVAFADVSAIQITVATTVDGFTYTKTGNSSEELDVGMDDGVVGFNTTVSAGDYQIFVAAQNDIVAATISLYLTVSPPVDDSPPNDDDSDISLTLSPPDSDVSVTPPVVTVTPPTVTVTVTANECDGIVFVAADGGGCELNSVFCPAPNIVEGPLCVANTEQMNVVTITATVTVTVMVAVLSEGENVINYAGELVTVTTQAGTTDAFGVLESGVRLHVAAGRIEIPANTNVGGGGGSSGGSAAGIIGGVVVVGLALWYFASDSDDLEWTPSYAFRNNNGNISYSVGSRWTATTADNWNLYWQTRQNGDKFVYGSGFGYNGNILSAAMNSESENDKTDLDLNLSANKTVGLWNFGGGYRFDMELSDDATETQNRLNAQVRYVMDKWILSANANTDGKKGAARINYSYRF